MTVIIPIEPNTQPWAIEKLGEHVATATGCFPDTLVATSSMTVADLCDKIGVNYLLSKDLNMNGLNLSVKAGKLLNCDVAIVLPIGESGIGFLKPLVEKVLDMETPAMGCTYRLSKETSDIKITTNRSGRVLYASRCPIPHGATIYKTLAKVLILNAGLIDLYDSLASPNTEDIELLKVIEADYPVFACELPPLSPVSPGSSGYRAG